MNRVSSRLALTSILTAVCGFATLTQSTHAEIRVAGNALVRVSDLTATDDPADLAKYGRLEDRIRAAAKRDGIAPSVVDAMIRIFADDIDLRRTAYPGDGFVVLTDEAAPDSVVFASLTFAGQTIAFYRFATPGGDIDYYDRGGRSADKLLVRRPLRDGWLNTPFGAQRHPILGTTRVHTGVDWEAPLASPIVAAGAGTVELAGWREGYGQTVRLRHHGGYETTYAHLLKIADGLKPGAQVERGQVIGSVGATGAASSPHLHYEVLINGRFVDPMSLRLPARHVLEGTTLAAFTVQRVEANSTRAASFHALFE